MKETTTTKSSKRVFAWVPLTLHRAAKIAAVEAGIDLQDWVAEAVAEKLERDSTRRVIPIDRRSH